MPSQTIADQSALPPSVDQIIEPKRYGTGKPLALKFAETFPKMNNVKAKTDCLPRTSQGDVFRDIECIEFVAEKRGILEVSKIVYPLVVVLTQD